MSNKLKSLHFHILSVSCGTAMIKSKILKSFFYTIGVYVVTRNDGKYEIYVKGQTIPSIINSQSVTNTHHILGTLLITMYNQRVSKKDQFDLDDIKTDTTPQLVKFTETPLGFFMPSK